MTQNTHSSEMLSTIVRALATGTSLQQVSQDSNLPYSEVTRIAKANGYPNRVMLAQSADRLEHQRPFAGDRQPAERIHTASLGGLLKRAHELGLGKKADRIRDLVHQLEDEVERKEPLAAALAELARAQAKVDELRGKAPDRPAVRGGAMDGLNREERKAVKAWAAGLRGKHNLVQLAYKLADGSDLTGAEVVESFRTMLDDHWRQRAESAEAEIERLRAEITKWADLVIEAKVRVDG